jgi:zinc transporter
MPESAELICAYLLDGHGGADTLDWPGVNAWTKEQGSIWLHLDCAHPNTDTWLRTHSGLDTFVIDGLLAEESRPRCDSYEDGILLVLRGVNLNQGAEPEDMVSIRIWVDEHRIISTRFRRLMAVQDIRDQLAMGKGPVSPGHLVARLAARLTDRMGPVIENLSDQVDRLEDRLIGSEKGEDLDLREVRYPLIDCRQVAISLRRYVYPQREALSRLAQFEEPWLDDRMLGRLREAVDQITRITEELDEVRERSAVVQDELANRISQRMERTMYTLTVVATVMLPLGFLTGLLGINVGGIPGADTGWAFWAVCGGLVALVAVEVLIMRRFKWI